MYRPDRIEHPIAPTLFGADPKVMRRGRLRRSQHAADEVAQDFVQYSLDDYARRRRGAATRDGAARLHRQAHLQGRHGQGSSGRARIEGSLR